MLFRLLTFVCIILLAYDHADAGNRYGNHHGQTNPAYACRSAQDTLSRSEWELYKSEIQLQAAQKQLGRLLELQANATCQIDQQIAYLESELRRLTTERSAVLNQICQGVQNCQSCAPYKRALAKYDSAIKNLQRNLLHLQKRRNHSLSQLNAQIARCQAELVRAEQVYAACQLRFELAAQAWSECLASCSGN